MSSVPERPTGPIPEVEQRIEAEAADLPAELRAVIASCVSALLRGEAGKLRNPLHNPSYEQLMRDWPATTRLFLAKAREQFKGDESKAIAHVHGELFTGLVSAWFS